MEPDGAGDDTVTSLFEKFQNTVKNATDAQLSNENSYALLKGKIRKIAKEQNWLERTANSMMIGVIEAERDKREWAAFTSKKQSINGVEEKSNDFDPFKELLEQAH